jgi:RHS repeat-associated protein
VDSVTGTIARDYDGLDHLVSETTPQGTVAYSYDAAGRRASLSVSGQPDVNYTFDEANRLTQINQNSSTVSFTFDSAGRRTAMTLPNGVTASYSYDDASQLTGLSYATNSGPLGNLTYAYDMAGHRVSVGGTLAQTNLPSPVSVTAYNANNQLTTWGTANLFYDANGNMTSDGTNSFVWNARNKLASMNFASNSFQYDPFCRRQAKTISGTTTNYLYAGVNVAQELSGSSPTANLLSGEVDEIFTRTDSSGTANFVTDALGSTLALTNGSGSTVASYAYDPFGSTTQTGGSANPNAYTGREKDVNGLYYYRARYYSPSLQRFVSEDPVGVAGGINLYAYAGNDPVDNVDPSGKYDWPYHVYITYVAAMNAGYNSDQAWELAKAVANVDFDPGTQGGGANAANAHAMAGRKDNGKQQTCQQAYQGSQNQLVQDTDSGKLAAALHMIQDATSPSHAGYQFWNGGNTPLHLPGPTHFAKETFLGPYSEPIQTAIQNSTTYLQDLNSDSSALKYPSNKLPQNPCGH